MIAKNVRASQPYFWQSYQTNKSEAKKYIFYMCIALNGFHLTVSFGFCFFGGEGGHIGGCNFLDSHCIHSVVVVVVVVVVFN